MQKKTLPEIETLKKIMPAYTLASQQLEMAEHKYQKSYQEILDSAEQKKEDALKEYNRICREIDAKAEQQLLDISVSNELKDRAGTLKLQVINNVCEVLQKIKISHREMCSLMHKTTGQRWKTFKLAGQHDNLPNQFCYGVAFVREDNKLYNRFFRTIHVKNISKSDSLIPFIFSCKNDIVRLSLQEEVDSFNWGAYYLYKTTGINTSKYNIPLIVDKHPTFAANVLKSIEEKYIDEKDINTIE